MKTNKETLRSAMDRRLSFLDELPSCRAALLSLNLPYDAACYEDADAILCAFNPFGSAHDTEGNGPFNLNVAAALCAAFGESVPQGTLPVNVPKFKEIVDDKTVFSDELLYERGFGLQDWKQAQ